MSWVFQVFNCLLSVVGFGSLTHQRFSDLTNVILLVGSTNKSLVEAVWVQEVRLGEMKGNIES